MPLNKAKTGTDELRALIRDLGKLPDEMRRELRREMRKAGQAALTQARANAAFSSRIPAATKLSISFAKRRPGVALVVNKNVAPHARVLEHLGRRGSFLHPVFGSKKRVRQPARPFFFRAAQEAWRAIDADIAQAVDRAARKHGFKE
ncbi:HK97 gp10 family phage protein [Planobispora rosea]|uniref:HK97 gp10 family phage protein n=1 Tax=Planobispora rosea TaxID=35762 RepID=UPI00083B1672|nr:HK97 gp10 family phage protein [Planobispora rosea]